MKKRNTTIKRIKNWIEQFTDENEKGKAKENFFLLTRRTREKEAIFNQVWINRFGMNNEYRFTIDGRYWCSVCKKTHQLNSKVGHKHFPVKIRPKFWADISILDDPKISGWKQVFKIRKTKDSKVVKQWEDTGLKCSKKRLKKKAKTVKEDVRNGKARLWFKKVIDDKTKYRVETDMYKVSEIELYDPSKNLGWEQVVKLIDTETGEIVDSWDSIENRNGKYDICTKALLMENVEAIKMDVENGKADLWFNVESN